jgi:hypothetical protein
MALRVFGSFVYRVRSLLSWGGRSPVRKLLLLPTLSIHYNYDALHSYLYTTLHWALLRCPGLYNERYDGFWFELCFA